MPTKNEREQKIARLKALNAALKLEQFGEYTPMIGEGSPYEKSPFPPPPVYPKLGEHPRFLMTPEQLPRVKEMFNDAEFSKIKDNLLRLADMDIGDGIFPEVVGKSGEIYRYDPEILAAIDSKAFMYMLTGDELYALEAIVGIKNAMLTLKFTKDIHGDTYHGASHVLITLCCVNDWCHNYLNDADKDQILAGVVSRMMPCLEFDYPPSKFSYVSGHGTGPQFLRDFMAIATAFYDEAPDWWEFVVGRYFAQHVRVSRECLKSGWVSQGTGNYAYNKLLVQLWAAALIFNATGMNPLPDDAGQGIYFLISHSMPNGLYLQTGDGGRGRTGASRSAEFGNFFMTASIWNDPVAYANAKKMTNGFEKYINTCASTMTPSMQLALLSRVKYNGEGVRDGVPLIQYFAEPAGQMTARNSWDSPDAAIAYMKIGNMNMANHDHSDHGTFQLYYKGLLACASGQYAKYHCYHHKFYQKATISANGLTVFDPSKADAEPIYGKNEDGTVNTAIIENAKRYYYSGSQRFLQESGTLENWKSGDYELGKMTGVAYGYDHDGSADFAYIAGDITNAYHPDTVEYAARRMLAVFTGNKSYPMLFFTYDTLRSTDPSFEKKFILHTADEPVIDEKALSADVTEGQGRLFVQNLFGAKKISKIGGKGYAYWINGKNCLDAYTKDDKSDLIWGRIEFSADGEKETHLLTAMYVTDRTNGEKLPIEKYETENAYAAKLLDNVVLFVKDTGAEQTCICVDIPCGRVLKYYVVGATDGEWQITKDGVVAASCEVQKGEGVLTFVAPPGKICIKRK